MKTTIVVIAAEGDSAKTEQWYLKALKEHYQKSGKEVRALVLTHSSTTCTPSSLARCVKAFFVQHNVFNIEIHAQAGLGASLAYQMLELRPDRIRRVFFVGGAPSNAMTGIAKIFHRYLSRLWYLSHIPFFADDPNPARDPIIDKIRASSTAAMRENPLRYRNQLVHIGTWQLPPHWRVPNTCDAYFVPNGETVRPHWWDNSFNNVRASQIWAEHGVKTTRRPGGYFSLYSMMPASELFKVMDEVRVL